MIEDHVPSWKTCQRLKEKGFPQETHFTWAQNNTIYKWCVVDTVDHDDGWEWDYSWEYAAPILSEVLELLPPAVAIAKGTIRGEVKYIAVHDSFVLSQKYIDSQALNRFMDNPVESAALLWLELKEDNGPH